MAGRYLFSYPKGMLVDLAPPGMTEVMDWDPQSGALEDYQSACKTILELLAVENGAAQQTTH